MSGRLTHWARGFLVIAAVLMLAGAFLALLNVNIPEANRDVVMVLIGAVIARSEKIDGFFFGSSNGSEAKSALLSERPSGNPADPLHVEDEPVTFDRPKFGEAK